MWPRGGPGSGWAGAAIPIARASAGGAAPGRAPRRPLPGGLRPPCPWGGRGCAAVFGLVPPLGGPPSPGPPPGFAGVPPPRGGGAAVSGCAAPARAGAAAAGGGPVSGGPPPFALPRPLPDGGPWAPGLRPGSPRPPPPRAPAPPGVWACLSALPGGARPRLCPVGLRRRPSAGPGRCGVPARGCGAAICGPLGRSPPLPGRAAPPPLGGAGREWPLRRPDCEGVGGAPGAPSGRAAAPGRGVPRPAGRGGGLRPAGRNGAPRRPALKEQPVTRQDKLKTCPVITPSPHKSNGEKGWKRANFPASWKRPLCSASPRHKFGIIFQQRTKNRLKAAHQAGFRNSA